MFKRKKLAAAMVFCLMSAGIWTSFAQADSASDLQQKENLVQQLQNEAQQINQQISQEETQVQITQNAIASDQASINNLNESITQTNTQIIQVEDEISSLQQEVATEQQKIATDKSSMSQLLVMFYGNNGSSFTQFLLNSSSFYNFLQRINDMKDLMNAFNALNTDIQATEATVESQIAQENVQKTQLQTTENGLQNLVATKTQVEQNEQASLANQQSQVNQTSNQKNILESQITLTQQQVATIKEQLLQAQELESQQSYVQQQQNQLVSASASAIIQYAEQFEGLPYVWGGTTPNPGFDCSGFTQFVFAHFGITIPRTSEEQFAVGVPVQENDLQPGDLVFFSTYAPGATHVGIYVGNNMMLDSEDLGIVFDDITNSYWAPKYLGARRFIK